MIGYLPGGGENITPKINRTEYSTKSFVVATLIYIIEAKYGTLESKYYKVVDRKQHNKNYRMKSWMGTKQ